MVPNARQRRPAAGRVTPPPHPRPAHRFRPRAGAWLPLLLLALLLPGPRAWAAVPVTVSIHPLALLVAEVGGDAVEVRTLLAPGASPHGFEPRPSQVRDLARAHLLVTVGAGLDPWADRLHEAVAADVPWLELADHVPLVPFREPDHDDHDHEADHAEDHDGPADPHGHGHGHGAGDPHFWLDPVRVRDHAVPAIVAALSAAAPGEAAGFAARGAAFRERLGVLDRELAEGLAPVAGRAFVAFHSAFTYFAARYGLRQVGVVEPIPGREPSARWMRDVVQAARDGGARAVLIEPQFNPRVARNLARQFDGRVITVDPIGDPSGPSGRSYAGLMRFNLRAFTEALAP
jgi:zinc transport system substrate-binding protein